jgi:hypothetical protein
VTVVSRQWDKVEDKYAVSAIGVAGIVALWTAVGAIKVLARGLRRAIKTRTNFSFFFFLSA